MDGNSYDVIYIFSKLYSRSFIISYDGAITLTMKKKKHDTHFLHIHEKMMTTSYAVVYTEKIYVYKCVQFLGRKKKTLVVITKQNAHQEMYSKCFLARSQGGYKKELLCREGGTQNVSEIYI